MPWHRSTGVPRAHWVLLALGLFVLLSALVLGGVVSHPGVGTVQPGRLGGTAAPRTISDPVIAAPSTPLARRRLVDRTVALTFDDGPDPVWTPRILDALAAYHVRATFFVVGSRVTEHPELVRRILAEGHELGLHSYSHRNLVELPTWQQSAELELSRIAVAHATGKDVRLFRPPFLGTPAEVDAPAQALIDLAGRQGYTTVLGDMDTRDWLPRKADVIAGAAGPYGTSGAIVVMHDGGGDRTETVAALSMLIPALQPIYDFLTVSEAIGVPTARSGIERSVQISGWALAVTQRLATSTSVILFWLLVPATGLALSRMVIQVVCARRHIRRRPGAEPSSNGPDPPDPPDPSARPEPPDPSHRPEVEVEDDVEVEVEDEVEDDNEWVPPISVIVPAHNEAANIVATVRSLVRNRYPDLEVIVVDDGSTDGTGDLVANLPGVRVIRQHNAGKAKALRRGVAAARHDILVMIDGDTIVERDTLRLLIQPLRQPEVGAVAGNAKVANRGGLLGRWQHVEYVVTFNLDRRVFDQAECMPTVPGAIGAFRRGALRAAGDITSETLAEDTDLTMAICRAGFRVVYVDHARAWTEAPGTWAGLWRQRYRWCYGTMQAMWKHRSSLREPGASGKLGRRGLLYIFFFLILQPLLAPLVDLFLLYTLLFEPLGWPLLLWVALHTAQLGVAWYAFRLDKEPYGPLWTFLLQQIAYRQLIYLVVIQSGVTALLGARMRWHQPARTGHAAALDTRSPTQSAAAARTRETMRRLRAARTPGPLWARLTAAAGVVLLFLSAASLGGIQLLTQRYEDALHHADLLGVAAAYPDPDRLQSGPLDILLLGIDWRQGEAGLIRADTIMVLHVARGLDRAYLLSIPRDALVTIPAVPETGYRGGTDRVNAAFAYGAGDEQDRARGGRIMAQTLTQVTGLPGFSAAALIDFYGFTNVVQTIGDIEMCVDAETESLSGVVYHPGCSRMDAISALDYVRQRKQLAGGDYARQRHQQQFIKAVLREVRAQGIMTDPARLDQLIRAAAGAMTVTTGPIGTFELLLSLQRISPDTITMVRAPGDSIVDGYGTYVGLELSPISHELFDAARQDTMDQFMLAHPELVNQET